MVPLHFQSDVEWLKQIRLLKTDNKTGGGPLSQYEWPRLFEWNKFLRLPVNAPPCLEERYRLLIVNIKINSAEVCCNRLAAGQWFVCSLIRLEIIDESVLCTSLSVVPSLWLIEHRATATWPFSRAEYPHAPWRLLCARGRAALIKLSRIITKEEDEKHTQAWLLCRGLLLRLIVHSALLVIDCLLFTLGVQYVIPHARARGWLLLDAVQAPGARIICGSLQRYQGVEPNPASRK